MALYYTRFDKTWWFLLGVTLLVSGITARLGFWQMSRAQQKEHLFEQQQSQQLLPALNNEQLLNWPAGAPGLYRSVQLQGQWLDRYTVYLDNRTMDQRSGFIVLTPLQIKPGTAVWVQRGWIARDRVRSDFLPPITTPNTPIEVRGLWVPPPSKLMELSSPTENPDSTFQRLRANVDWELFQIETGLHLVATLQQTHGFDDGLLRNWASPLSGSAKNWGYAAQWFGLSTLCAGLFIWFQVLKKRPQHG